MKVKISQHVAQSKGGRHEYPRRIIDWPDGLSMPHNGDFLTLAEDDEDEVRDVNYTPLKATVATIVLRPAVAEDPQTAAEWVAEHRPGWDMP